MATNMVDIHSHILPEVDDGAKSWEMAVEMCRMAAADGITHVVATPHSNDQFHYDRRAHEALLAELRERVHGEIELSLGCDFHLSFDNIVALRRNPAEFCIGRTRYLLVEFSDFGISRQLLQTLEEFLDQGLVPIVTHPERNRMLQSQPETVVAMAEVGCVIQVTAGSFAGSWGRGPRKVSEWLLKKGAVHVLASDAHDPEHRKPILSRGRAVVAELVGDEVADLLVRKNPGAIVRGESLV
jgi:protein-tyrosine phosphatase